MKSQAHIKLLTALTMSGVMFGASQTYANIVFGDFEQPIYVVNSAANDHSGYLWYHYPNGVLGGAAEIGSVSLSSEKSALNKQSAKVNMSSGAVYFQFYPKIGSHYKYLREVVSEDLKLGKWENNHYNRMEFFVLVPEQVTERSGGRYNMTVGTYVRATTADRTKAESHNAHFYHRFDIPYSGVWHKVVMDTHPSHQRAISGSTEHGDMRHPTGENNYNYFDLLTRFYVDFEASNVRSNPAIWHFDGFRIYSETRTENEEQVYSMHGSYNDQRLTVGWNRNKDENNVSHEIRYAFQDIHQLGWSRATPAPGSPLKPQGHQGYNGMLYQTDQVDASGHDTIYVAVKPQNSNLFKQISIPISLEGGISRPNPPISPNAQSLPD